MQPGPAAARSGVRRPVLRGRQDHEHLLPPGLYRQTAADQEHPLLSQRRRGRTGRLPSLLALQAGNRAVLPGLERHQNHGGTGAPANRTGRAGHGRRGRPGGSAGRRTAPPVAAIQEAPRRLADPDGKDAPHPAGQTAAGPDRAADDRDRVPVGVSQRPKLQRRLLATLRSAAVGHAAQSKRQ